MNIRALVFFFAMFFSVVLYAQQLVPLQGNAALEFLQAQKRMAYALTDTLEIPLQDDFSKGSVFPDTSLWCDSLAFVNSDYPVDPPTIGVVTLDGVNRGGRPYDNSNPNTYGVADYLTSRPINLAYAPQDSVYLSFFYQAEGLGNFPDPPDSLVLELLNATSGAWSHVWSVQGMRMAPFKQVMVAIKDTAYLKKGFRFRFKNYATLSGNVDHWNIDYVRLGKGRTKKDTILFQEVAFIDHPRSFLKNYESMPWSHYLADPSPQMRDSISFRLRNNDIAIKNISYAYEVKDGQGTSVFTHPFASYTDMPSYGIFTKKTDVQPSVFSYADPDSATFTIKHWITPDQGYNDTVVFRQNFHNYYAYDDGTAEAGYGVNSYNSTTAMRFFIGKEDTVRGVHMYFNRIYNNVGGRKFRLVIWKELSPEQILYTGPEVNPKYIDSLNGFYNYAIDTPLVVSGTIYVGWRQLTGEILNVGFDRNIDHMNDMYYNITGNPGNWQPMQFTGSLMVRPVFGKKVAEGPVGITEVSLNDSSMDVFPNPSSGPVRMLVCGYVPASVLVFGTQGSVMEFLPDSDGLFHTDALAPGFYVAAAKDRNGSIHRKKIIISR
jgi:hypothetical protein